MALEYTPGNGDLAKLCAENHERLRQVIGEDISEAIGSAAIEASRARQAAERAADEATRVVQEIAWLKEGQRQIIDVLARHDRRWTTLDARVDEYVATRARVAEASIAEIHVGAARVSVSRLQAITAVAVAVLGTIGTIAGAYLALRGGQ
jgi:hypothetical protein